MPGFALTWKCPMDDLERGMVALRDGLVPAWDAERSARVYAGVGQLRRRRAVRRAGFAAAGATLLAVAVFAAVPRGAGPEIAREATAPRVAVPQAPAPKAAAVAVAAPAPVATPAPADAEGTLRLADGSVVESINGAADVRVVRDEATRVEITLVAGHARFDVVRRPARSFEVTAGAWRVLVVGTRFDVQRAEGGVRVSVARGLVRVQGPGGPREIAAGETAWLVEPAPTRARPRAAVVAPRADATPDWRQLIQGGDHDGAYHMLQAGARVDDDPWSLMDAADAARLSGHPDGAVGYLDRVVRDHGTSPVAPLAAFTLGRIELDRLGRPHDAAQAFAAARTLAPGGSLAQDALAREVEAWSKAGDVEQAYRRAQEYVITYPDGRRLTAVRRYGGLEKIE